jgi:hypothetical protein
MFLQLFGHLQQLCAAVLAWHQSGLLCCLLSVFGRVWFVCLLLLQGVMGPELGLHAKYNTETDYVCIMVGLRGVCRFCCNRICLCELQFQGTLCMSTLGSVCEKG